MQVSFVKTHKQTNNIKSVEISHVFEGIKTGGNNNILK